MGIFDLDTTKECFQGPEQYSKFLEELRKQLKDNGVVALHSGDKVLGYMLSAELMTKLAHDEIARRLAS